MSLLYMLLENSPLYLPSLSLRLIGETGFLQLLPRHMLVLVFVSKDNLELQYLLDPFDLRLLDGAFALPLLSGHLAVPILVPRFHIGERVPWKKLGHHGPCKRP